MNGDLYYLAKSYQQEQIRLARGERTWRVRSERNHWSMQKAVLAVATFIASFF